MARGRSVGVDVEQIRPGIDVGAIATRFFPSHERADLAALPTRDQLAAFFRCWCRKEAFIKAIGLGHSYPLADFDVSLARHASPVLLQTRPDDKEAGRWHIRDIDLDAQHMAALALEGADVTLAASRQSVHRDVCQPVSLNVKMPSVVIERHLIASSKSWLPSTLLRGELLPSVCLKRIVVLI